MIEYLKQDWSSSGSSWENDELCLYTYDVNYNMIEELKNYWDDSSWVILSEKTYTYDMNNNLIEELWQGWWGLTWTNQDLYTYTYDGNNNMTELLHQYWDGSSWVNSMRDVYSYIPTGIEDYEYLVTAYSLSQNYPNPFNPSTTIKYQIPELSLVTLKVYDVLGSEIITLVNEEKPLGSYEVDFSVGQNSILSLSSGIYFYRLQVYAPGRAGSFVETKKMMLLR